MIEELQSSKKPPPNLKLSDKLCKHTVIAAAFVTAKKFVRILLAPGPARRFARAALSGKA
jgi:hypothetical protein